MQFTNEVSVDSPKYPPKGDLAGREESGWFEESNRLDNVNKKQNIGLRRLYAKLVFSVMCLWLSVVLGIVIFDGGHLLDFSLPQAVVITLLSTTTANMLGIWAIIFTYLFR